MREKTCILLVGWGISICGDAPSFVKTLTVLMVTTFPMWSTGYPVELSVVSAAVVSNIGSP